MPSALDSPRLTRAGVRLRPSTTIVAGKTRKCLLPAGLSKNKIYPTDLGLVDQIETWSNNSANLITRALFASYIKAASNFQSLNSEFCPAVMRCTLCETITIDATNGGTKREAATYRENPEYVPGFLHQPSFTALRLSAQSGCDLCKVFEEAFVESTDLSSLLEREKSGATHQIVIRSDIYLQGLVTSNEFEGSSHLTVEIKLGADLGEVRERDDPASEDARILGRPISVDPKSHINQLYMLGALHSCRISHKAVCGEVSGLLPTRVIDVGPRDGSQEPHLMITDGEEGSYVTLSHCWGTQPTLTTTLATLAERLQVIPLGKMPQTFADAVWVTRVLGIQALWIDSLCILQDSHEDWVKESTKMRDVYKNAVLTISAAMAPDSHRGFLNKRDEELIKPLASIPHFAPGSKEPGTLYLRRDMDSWERTVVDGVLAKRAWTLQERLLSKRVLHFGDFQMSWECKTRSFSEGRHLPMNYYAAVGKESLVDKSLIDYRQRGSHTFLEFSAFARWYVCLEEYTRRAMTKETDKLPAISGLAREIRAQIQDIGAYAAGLWREDFLRALLWKAVENGNLKTPSEYIAPSWSWASVIGQVSVDYATLDRCEEKSSAEIIQVDVTLANEDEFGQISGGSVVIRGLLRLGFYIGNQHQRSGPTVYGRSGYVLADGSDPKHLVYHLFEKDETQEKDTNHAGGQWWKILCECWFDQAPGPENRYYGLLRIGNWAPILSSRESGTGATLPSGLQMKVLEWVSRAADATYTPWALILDPDTSTDKSLKRVGVAKFLSPTAFDGCDEITYIVT